ncbi:hypothetical protein LCGC14_0405490 [marine sediment metagenome]|uniref:Uncharacterized protein n=1 Tax=marine sediment metagenome TaxID=412755 RepID=A0A0F9SVK3_9ZZZZ
MMFYEEAYGEEIPESILDPIEDNFREKAIALKKEDTYFHFKAFMDTIAVTFLVGNN